MELHNQVETRQAVGGYNDIYDAIFSAGTCRLMMQHVRYGYYGKTRRK